jgi:uroporphyrin-3 C-methyltransferase
VAIAIALAAGVGLYGWGNNRQQPNGNQRCAGEPADGTAKSAGKQKAELEGIIKQQATQLDEATRQQAALVKQLDEVQQKVATISGSDAKHGCWRRLISW